MAFEDYKISNTEKNAVNVKSNPDTLKGTASENKNVFDRLPELIISKFNALLDAIRGEIADDFIDESLSAESDKAVANRVIKEALDNKADIDDIPTALSELTDDSTHRLVTDTEKTTWNGKVDKVTTGLGKEVYSHVGATQSTTALAGSINSSVGSLIPTVSAVLGYHDSQKADDSAVVHKTSDETISGNKDFEGQTTFEDDIFLDQGGGDHERIGFVSGRVGTKVWGTGAPGHTYAYTDELLGEAPNDGKQYARKNKAWAEVVGGGGIPDAPSDGKTYGRKDGDWEEVTGGGGGEPVPCSYTIKVVDIITTQKYEVTNFKSGTGFIGQAVTFNIPAINRALGNSDNHQSGDTWYTVFGLSSTPLETSTDIVQVMLEEDNQVIEFSGRYRRKA